MTRIFFNTDRKNPENLAFQGFTLVGLTGLEPVTPTMSTWYSNQLSYNPEAENDISMKQGDLLAAFEHFIVGPDQTNGNVKYNSAAGKVGPSLLPLPSQHLIEYHFIGLLHALPGDAGDFPDRFIHIAAGEALRLRQGSAALDHLKGQQGIIHSDRDL